jgi:hypothetical protein
MSDRLAEIEARFNDLYHLSHGYWSVMNGGLYGDEVAWLMQEVRRLRNERGKLRKNIQRLLGFIEIECPGSEERLAEWVNSKQEDGA